MTRNLLVLQFEFDYLSKFPEGDAKMLFGLELCCQHLTNGEKCLLLVLVSCDVHCYIGLMK